MYIKAHDAIKIQTSKATVYIDYSVTVAPIHQLLDIGKAKIEANIYTIQIKLETFSGYLANCTRIAGASEESLQQFAPQAHKYWLTFKFQNEKEG